MFIVSLCLATYNLFCQNQNLMNGLVARAEDTYLDQVHMRKTAAILKLNYKSLVLIIILEAWDQESSVQ